ncbi:MAG: tRNA 4-thiouridine(8) synthase ThiI [Nanoarchaeota archaeon]|nr:tRNA 4-thiouridine(8) synthase ThiI [Nanoarchaeota archaeon]MBU4351672.1 tRNA 4-thiouridine(8) synthase ThiI [Nanoarchaeota archaeon]MBU4456586.1 tRNA 4-thiouridine(8) synthase ThiI [Nanoarchaeota archaeon]MCG2720130.1 tRNA 4-thiouridine(8) synthase ThiI [Nanoarchaeota archaeon]
MKAVAMLSGGLDSIVACKLIQEQGIEVIALHFITPFFGKKDMDKIAKNYGINVKIIDVGKEFLKILRKPKHGYGKNLNPCIDCKIFLLKLAKRYAKKIGGKFIITGEVIGQRPMSQNKGALQRIAKEARVKNMLVRPLCAKNLQETGPEKKGYVDRTKLLDISGRSRSRQMALAKKFGIDKYPSPAGGCLLTCIDYSRKAKDILNKKRISQNDLYLLRYGRHFRFGKSKIIVGKNDKDNLQLLNLKQKADYVFTMANNKGPVTLLQGPKTKETIKMAAQLTARYAGEKGNNKVKLNKRIIVVEPMEEKEIEKLRI